VTCRRFWIWGEKKEGAWGEGDLHIVGKSGLRENSRFKTHLEDGAYKSKRGGGGLEIETTDPEKRGKPKPKGNSRDKVRYQRRGGTNST